MNVVNLANLTDAELVAVTNDRGDAMVEVAGKLVDSLEHSTERFLAAVAEQTRRIGLIVDQASIDRAIASSLNALRQEGAIS